MNKTWFPNPYLLKTFPFKWLYSLFNISLEVRVNAHRPFCSDQMCAPLVRWRRHYVTSAAI